MESTVIIKAFQLLEAVAAEPGVSLAQLARQLGISKPSVHRVLGELRSLGYVQRDARGTYTTAPAIWRLLPGAHGRLLAAAGPIMKKLWRRTHETINLGVLRGQQVQYLLVLNSDLPLRRDVTAGELDPALTTALGRIMVSGLSEVDQAPFLKSLPGRLTPRTLTTKKELQEALQLAARQGYAVDSEETDLGVLCVAAAVSLQNGTEAALSISLPTARLESRGGIESLSRLVLKGAAAVSRRLKSREQISLRESS